MQLESRQRLLYFHEQKLDGAEHRRLGCLELSLSTLPGENDFLGVCVCVLGVSAQDFTGFSCFPPTQASGLPGYNTRDLQQKKKLGS